MNGLPYYKAYPRDFIEGTVGMSFEIKAAYRILLDIIYMRGGDLPDDPRYISGILGCSVRAWNKYRSALIEAGKIEVNDGIISNSRADKELESLRTLQEKQSENRSRPNKNKDLESPRCHHTEPEPEKKKEEPKGSSKKTPAKKKYTPLPDGWQLPKDWGEWALAQGMDEFSVRREAAQFEDHHRSKGNTMIDWRRAWQTWVRNALKWQEGKRGQRVQERPGYTNAGAFGMIPEVG